MLNLITLINITILIYFIVASFLYMLLLFGSFPAILRYFTIDFYSNRKEIANNENLPPVTTIIPMFNERLLIKDALLSVLNSTYKNHYILLINDGSTDDSLNYLINEFQLTEVPLIIDEKIPTKKVKQAYISEKHINLMVIDKENGGTGDAVNVGVNCSFSPYIFTMDADSVIDPDAISNLMYEILISDNGVAAGGGVYLLNGCKVKNGHMEESTLPFAYTAGIQSAEYLRSHLFNRTGWNSFGGTMSYSGTATVFNRQAIIEAGGFDPENYAQDSEIVMRLHRIMHENKKKYTIDFNPVATIWTDVPSTLKSFARQRDRWHRGLLRSIFKNMKMLFNPHYKKQGLFGFPAYIFLEILGPYVEFIAYFTVGLSYYYGLLDGVSALLFIILAWGFASFLTVANTFVSIITFNRYQRISDVFIMLLFATLEMFGFRQYRVLITIYATFHYAINRIRGKAL